MHAQITCEAAQQIRRSYCVKRAFTSFLQILSPHPTQINHSSTNPLHRTHASHSPLLLFSSSPLLLFSPSPLLLFSPSPLLNFFSNDLPVQRLRVSLSPRPLPLLPFSPSSFHRPPFPTHSSLTPHRRQKYIWKFGANRPICSFYVAQRPRFASPALRARTPLQATLAQLVEHSIRNRKVIGSSPMGGSISSSACHGSSGCNFTVGFDHALAVSESVEKLFVVFKSIDGVR